MTMHNCTETKPVTNSIQSLAAVMDLAILMQRKMADFASQLSEALDRLQTTPAVETSQTQRPARQRQKHRKTSSALSQKEQQIWACVHVQGKTIAQTAIELSCTPQNISKHLNNAQGKINARQSRSVNSRHRLPQDNRGQMTAC